MAGLEKYNKALNEILNAAIEGEISEYLTTMNYLGDNSDFASNEFAQIIEYLTANDSYGEDGTFCFTLIDDGDFEFSGFIHTVCVKFGGTKDKIEVSCEVKTEGEFSPELFEDKSDEEISEYNCRAVENPDNSQQAQIDTIAEALYFIDVQISYARKIICQVYGEIEEYPSRYTVGEQSLNQLYKKAVGQNLPFIND